MHTEDNANLSEALWSFPCVVFGEPCDRKPGHLAFCVYVGNGEHKENTVIKVALIQAICY